MQEIDLSGFDFSDCWSAAGIFDGCSALQTIKSPINVNCFGPLPGVFEDAEGNLYTRLPMDLDHSITLTKAPNISEWLSDYTCVGGYYMHVKVFL